MPHLFMDFETRSTVDLRKSQATKYAADPSTVPLLLSYGTGLHRWQWRLPPDYDSAETPPACPENLLAFINDPEVTFHAHNAAFEIAIWEGVCVGRWGWPSIPLERWQCTAAKAAAANMPRALEGVANRLKLPKNLQKSPTGKALIEALSKPTRAQKTERRDGTINKLSLAYQTAIGTRFFDYPWGSQIVPHFFNNDPELMEQYAAYNMQDIVAEEAVNDRLPPFSPGEIDVWRLDQRINRRGIPIDVKLCHGAIALQRSGASDFNSEIERLTGGEVEAGTQRERINKWLNRLVNFGETLAEDFVNDWVDSYTDPSTWRSGIVNPGLDPDDVMPVVLKVLELRSGTAGTAVAKFQAALDSVGADGRARDQLLYYGATTTGRWAGRGIQPHNMKRAKTPDDSIIGAIQRGEWFLFRSFCDMVGKSPLSVLKGSVRGMVLAPPGKKLIVSDFAGIESRVLNWLCGNTEKLDLFRSNQDTYIRAALDVYGGTEEDIADWTGKKWKIKKEHEEKRQVGKVCELALGYGMGPGKFVDTARKMAGVSISPEFAEEVVSKWRNKNHRVYSFWKRIEQAARYQIRLRKSSTRKGNTLEDKLRVDLDHRGYLTIQLPSGRKLHYYQPGVDDDGRLLYLDGSKQGKPENKGKIDTYGGKLTENVVQAISRDLLVHSMMMIEAMGLPIILHVHDEVVVEVDEDDTTALALVHRAMETLPDWATGLPLMAETQEMRRYSK